MTDKELSRVLLQLGSSEMSAAPAAQELTKRILARDQRRVRILAVVALCFWVLSAGVLYGFMFKLIGMMGEMQQPGRAPADPLITAIYQFLLGLAGSLESLILAFFCTLLLLFFSRRATLRQINAHLATISHQLEQTRQRPAPSPGSSSAGSSGKG
jgi:hypothetical protein